MRKHMIAVVAVALAAVGFADCGPDANDCNTVFALKFSGKTACQREGKPNEYKSVRKLSGKGLLSLSGDDSREEFTEVKIAKRKYGPIAVAPVVRKCTIFGKNLAMLENGTYEPGKSYKLDSDIYMTVTNATDRGINIEQVGFGTVKVTISKEKRSACGAGVAGCIPTITPISYAGWFTGSFDPVCMDEAAYADDCNSFDDSSDVALIGGTWTARFKKKQSSGGK